MDNEEAVDDIVIVDRGDIVRVVIKQGRRRTKKSRAAAASDVCKKQDQRNPE